MTPTTDKGGATDSVRSPGITDQPVREHGCAASPDNPLRHEITDPEHLLELGMMYGMQAAQRVLNQHAAKYPVPGIGLAIAVVGQIAAQQQTFAIQKNLMALTASGVDLTAVSNIRAVGAGLEWDAAA